jgi:hypothetical protein
LGDLSGLQSLGELLRIDKNPKLTDFDFADLSTHDIDLLQVTNNASLTTALLPTDVTSIENFLQYSGNPLLTNISEMEELTYIGSYLSIIQFQAGVFPKFSKLTSIGTVSGFTSGLYIAENPNISALPLLPALTDFGGLMRIDKNPNLTDFDFADLSTQDINYLQVTNNASLTTALLPTDVTSIANWLQYSDNPLLTNISEMEDLIFIGNYLAIQDFQAGVFPKFSKLASIGTIPSFNKGLYITNNPNISALPLLPSLTDFGGLMLINGNSNLMDFDFSDLSTQDISYLQVTNNASLTTALLPTGVTSIANWLQYSGNPLLSIISEMEDLTFIGNYLALEDIIACALPNYPNLSSIGSISNATSGFYLRNNPNISTTPSFSDNTTINERLFIQDNPSLSFCAIQAVCDYLEGVDFRIISNNSGECLNEATLSAHCGTSPPLLNADMDGDGIAGCAGDCDDDNDTVYPGAPEICDGIDNDCNGQIDEADCPAIPTMGQWGLFLFSLIICNLGLVFLYNAQRGEMNSRLPQ